jgi:GNAT superfamily N-acetyltransferase
MGRAQRYADRHRPRGERQELTLARKPKPLKARITHLEMHALPPHRVPLPVGPRVALMQVKAIPVSFYRYLYEQVGRAHHWSLRRSGSDRELRDILHSPATEISVLYVEGAPAGFFELNLADLPATVEILYFGLTRDFQGRGLARFFLSEAIFSAWVHEPGKVIIQTNTLDSPLALRLYQKMGFSPVGWSEEEVEPWL